MIHRSSYCHDVVGLADFMVDFDERQSSVFSPHIFTSPFSSSSFPSVQTPSITFSQDGHILFAVLLLLL